MTRVLAALSEPPAMSQPHRDQEPQLWQGVVPGGQRGQASPPGEGNAVDLLSFSCFFFS